MSGEKGSQAGDVIPPQDVAQEHLEATFGGAPGGFYGQLATVIIQAIFAALYHANVLKEEKHGPPPKEPGELAGIVLR